MNFSAVNDELNILDKMSGGVYGGDEVGALVFDPGHFSLRSEFFKNNFRKFLIITELKLCFIIIVCGSEHISNSIIRP